MSVTKYFGHLGITTCDQLFEVMEKHWNINKSNACDYSGEGENGIDMEGNKISDLCDCS